jgi:hypothetical protein
MYIPISAFNAEIMLSILRIGKYILRTLNGKSMGNDTVNILVNRGVSESLTSGVQTPFDFGNEVIAAVDDILYKRARSE